MAFFTMECLFIITNSKLQRLPFKTFIRDEEPQKDEHFEFTKYFKLFVSFL